MPSQLVGRGECAGGPARSGRRIRIVNRGSQSTATAPGRWLVAPACLLVLVLAGCALEPKGTEVEREKLATEGERYEVRFEERALPELPAAAGWRDILRRAFLASGELEAAYFDWKGALENVGIAS